MTVKHGDHEVDERASLQGLESSNVVPLEDFIPQTSWRVVQKACIKMLGEVVSSLLKPLKRAAESGFKVSLECKDTRKCFPIIMA